MIGHSFQTSYFGAMKATVRMSALALCCALGACSSIGFGGPELDVDQTVTSSVGSGSTLLAGIDPSDWDILLSKISSYDLSTFKADNIDGDWNNPSTGSKGRITQVTRSPALGNQECRSFKSSMHRVTGVENIQGEICRAQNGNWQITGFESGASA